MLSNVETRYQPEYTSENHDFRGKRIVIIGDGNGIGCATAALLAGKGARVFFAASTPAELNRAFVAIAREGGQWDGSVVDLQQLGNLRRLFDLAAQRLGKIDVFIHLLSFGEPETNQQFLREALRHMDRGARIIQVGLGEITKGATLSVEPGKAGQLRREALAAGIHLTRVEPGLADYRDLGYNKDTLNADDVAQTVYESLMQPFEFDVVYLPGKFLNTLM